MRNALVAYKPPGFFTFAEELVLREAFDRDDLSTASRGFQTAFARWVNMWMQVFFGECNYGTTDPPTE